MIRPEAWGVEQKCDGKLDPILCIGESQYPSGDGRVIRKYKWVCVCKSCGRFAEVWVDEGDHREYRGDEGEPV